jgi:hypothetical protein
VIKDIIQAVDVVKINRYHKYFQFPASLINTIDAAKQGK